MIIKTIIQGNEDVGLDDEQIHGNNFYIVFTRRINMKLRMSI